MNICTIIFHIVSGFSVVRKDFCDLLENGNLSDLHELNQIHYQQAIKPQTGDMEGYTMYVNRKIW